MGKVVTSAGFELTVIGISRKALDAFLLYRKRPVPPLKTVKAYKGFEEHIPDYDDAGYQEEYNAYVTAIAMDRFSLVIAAVTFDFNPFEREEFKTLVDAGIVSITTEDQARSDFVQFVALSAMTDIVLVMNEILYLSTVTERGIQEAGDAFDVTWLGKRIESWGVPGSKVKFTNHYEDRETACVYGLSWNEFCNLTGPEQSAFVAHNRIKNRIAWLMQRDSRTKKR